MEKRMDRLENLPISRIPPEEIWDLCIKKGIFLYHPGMGITLSNGVLKTIMMLVVEGPPGNFPTEEARFVGCIRSAVEYFVLEEHERGKADDELDGPALLKIAEGLLGLLILLRADAERCAKQALSGKYGSKEYKMFREAAEAFKAIMKNGNRARFNLNAALDFIKFEVEQKEKAGIP